MSAEALRSLDTQLEAYERSSGHQLLVYIGKTTGGVPMRIGLSAPFKRGRWDAKASMTGWRSSSCPRIAGCASKWATGWKGRCPTQWPPALSATLSSHAFRQGTGTALLPVRHGYGCSHAYWPGPGRIAAAQRGERGRGARPLTIRTTDLLWHRRCFVLVLLATNPGLAIYLVASILSGNREGSYRGGGGGGFGGGGGRSGGGGASGSW